MQTRLRPLLRRVRELRHDRPCNFADAQGASDQTRQSREAKRQAVFLVLETHQIAGLLQALHDAKGRGLRQLDAVGDFLQREAVSLRSKALENGKNALHRAHHGTLFISTVCVSAKVPGSIASWHSGLLGLVRPRRVAKHDESRQWVSVTETDIVHQN